MRGQWSHPEPLGTGKAAKIASGPRGLMQGIMPLGWSDPPERGTQDLLEGHDTMPWLRSVGDKVSTSVAGALLALQLYAVRRGGKAVRERSLQRAPVAVRTKALDALMRQSPAAAQEETDHVFLDALEAPNPFMGGQGLMKVTNLHVDLVGDAFWLVQRNGLGVPSGFWPVPPHWVTRTPSPDRPSYQVEYRTFRAEIPEAEVLPFHEPAPINPYARGSGVGWSIGDEVEVDEYAAKMAKALFFNQARPDFVVYGFSDDTEKKQVERAWRARLSGFWKTGQPYFLTGEPKFHEFTRPTMDQLVYPSLRKVQRDIVLQVWGAPPELFGILESSNRATIDAAEYLFLKYVVLARVERIRAQLQAFAAREYDARLIVHVPSCVPEDRAYVLQVARAVPQTRRVDEWRELQNLPPIGGAEGQAFPVPAGGGGAVEDLLAALEQARPPKAPRPEATE